MLWANGSEAELQYVLHRCGLKNLRYRHCCHRWRTQLAKENGIWGRTLGKEAVNIPATTPVQLEGLTGVVAVDAGWRGQLAVKDDGTVWSWVPDANRIFIPQQLEITDVKTISIKRGNAFALKNDGTVWSWGDESYTVPPTQVEGLYGIIAVEPREYDVTYKFKHVLALREDGVIVSWGDNANGQYNTAWRTAITEITVDGVVLATNKYQIGDGTITINTNDTEVFPEAKDYLIVVKATNYTDVSVTQTVNAPPIDECFIATASFGRNLNHQ